MFCFLNAVDMVLYCDHNDVLFWVNVKYYKWFHIGDVLKDAEKYFKFRTYCDNVLHVIVTATTKALKLNFTIYQKGPKVNI